LSQRGTGAGVSAARSICFHHHDQHNNGTRIGVPTLYTVRLWTQWVFKIVFVQRIELRTRGIKGKIIGQPYGRFAPEPPFTSSFSSATQLIQCQTVFFHNTFLPARERAAHRGARMQMRLAKQSPIRSIESSRSTPVSRSSRDKTGHPGTSHLLARPVPNCLEYHGQSPSRFVATPAARKLTICRSLATPIREPS